MTVSTGNIFFFYTTQCKKGNDLVYAEYIGLVYYHLISMPEELCGCVISVTVVVSDMNRQNDFICLQMSKCSILKTHTLSLTHILTHMSL